MTRREGGALGLGALGFGAAPIGNMLRALTDAETDATVQAAWSAGVRYFDTAPLYGHGLSERRVGAALRRRPRNAFMLSSKVGRLLDPCTPGDQDAGIYVDVPAVKARFDYSYDGVMRSFEDSLARLGMDRIDILYVHDIDAHTHRSDAAAEVRIHELMDLGGWRALDELRSAGDVCAIGAGVNACRPCERLLALADPDIFLLAGRFTLLDRSAAARLLPACEARGVSVVIGGPYNSGVLATGAVPGARYDYAPASETVLAKVRTLEAICARHDVRLADAALQFPLRHPAVVSVIPGGQTAAEVQRNAAGFQALLPADLWTALECEGGLADAAPQPAKA
ncbi:MAG: aldo/keto reductase [Alphaproteobacteria bacterium]|nr:aldo/keto reductase [Alphaproteobacteria bacterium]MBU1515188.1 aldo/keto reductase [Alphaproteobacteria bacterium]MBU2092318.1 aldo/keto reductase [Alphaproteobacteria bacterium]MBU2152912.1 aldo/keto reductase [Alphaproteobacteria bacterium]MBU2305743.1 aldo/keto reductase [Alphaproteobacteria bacterium]